MQKVVFILWWTMVHFDENIEIPKCWQVKDGSLGKHSINTFTKDESYLAPDMQYSVLQIMWDQEELTVKF